MRLFEKFFKPKPEASDIFLIIGLGNPGAQYKETRHNAGRDALLGLAERGDFTPWTNLKKYTALVSEGAIGGFKTTLFLPETFMNLSGQSVRAYLKYLAYKPQVVVVHDDIDLPVGKIRLGRGRGAGGHRGVASILVELGTSDFVRLRLGVGRSSEKVEEAVLQPVGPDEEFEFTKMKNLVGEVLQSLTTSGLEATMNKYN